MFEICGPCLRMATWPIAYYPPAREVRPAAAGLAHGPRCTNCRRWPTPSSSKAGHEAVVTKTWRFSIVCRFLLKTSERQRLPLDLPKDAELLDTQVAGREGSTWK
jgi:hypothetical protein